MQQQHNAARHAAPGGGEGGRGRRSGRGRCTAFSAARRAAAHMAKQVAARRRGAHICRAPANSAAAAAGSRRAGPREGGSSWAAGRRSRRPARRGSRPAAAGTRRTPAAARRRSWAARRPAARERPRRSAACRRRPRTRAAVLQREERAAVRRRWSGSASGGRAVCSRAADGAHRREAGALDARRRVARRRIACGRRAGHFWGAVARVIREDLGAGGSAPPGYGTSRCSATGR
jgi:hypothetical protein